MAETFTSKLKLSKRDTGDLNWGQGANTNLDVIDAYMQQSTLRPPRAVTVTLGSGAVGPNLTGNTTYFYKVTAVTSSGETTEGIIPTVIEGQVVQPGSPLPVIIQWETVKGASGYKIYKASAANQEKFLASIAGESTTSFTDNGNSAVNATLSVPGTNTASLSVGGVTDHGALTGLADDDHPQYLKKSGDVMSGDLVFGSQGGGGQQGDSIQAKTLNGNNGYAIAYSTGSGHYWVVDQHDKPAGQVMLFDSQGNLQNTFTYNELSGVTISQAHYHLGNLWLASSSGTQGFMLSGVDGSLPAPITVLNLSSVCPNILDIGPNSGNPAIFIGAEGVMNLFSEDGSIFTQMPTASTGVTGLVDVSTVNDNNPGSYFWGVKGNSAYLLGHGQNIGYTGTHLDGFSFAPAKLLHSPNGAPVVALGSSDYKFAYFNSDGSGNITEVPLIHRAQVGAWDNTYIYLAGSVDSLSNIWVTRVNRNTLQVVDTRDTGIAASAGLMTSLGDMGAAGAAFPTYGTNGSLILVDVQQGAGSAITISTSGKVTTQSLQVSGGNPGNGKVLTSDSTGLASWQPASAGGGVAGSGTVGMIPMWDSTTTLADGPITITQEGGAKVFNFGAESKLTSTSIQSNEISNAYFALRNHQLSLTGLNPCQLSTDGMTTSYVMDNLGVGTATPSTKLDVAGSIKITDGSQGAGKVLTSNSTGLATWQTPASGGGGGYATTVVPAPTGVAATDTSNIQTALNAKGIYVGGSTVVLREGTYLINATLNIPDNTILQGQGMSATIIKADTALGAVPLISHIGNGDHIELRDLKINGSFSTRGAVAANDLAFNGRLTRLVRISMIGHTSSTGSAIRMVCGSSALGGAIVRDCEFQAMGDMGSQTPACAGGFIQSNSVLIQGCVFRSYSGDIVLVSGLPGTNNNGKIAIIDNEFHLLGSDITYLIKLSSGIVANNRFFRESGTTSYSVSTAGVSATNISVTGNVALNSGNGAINVGGTLITVTGNAGFTSYIGGTPVGNA